MSKYISNVVNFQEYKDKKNKQLELDREELSFDERKYIIDKMLEVNQMKGMKDTENKKFLATLAMCGVAAVTVVAGTLAAVLGANTQIASKDDDEYNA